MHIRHKKTWLEAKTWATKQTCEVAQAAFCQCQAIGIALDDGIDDRVLVTAYFEPTAATEEQIESTLARFFNACDWPANEIGFSVLEEEDWQSNFRRSCTTFKVAPDIFIVPSFEAEQFKKQSLGNLYIEIDPENAFGTGQHQTTKLCLTRIHEIIGRFDLDTRSHLSCLDVGTGSGILAVLMKKLAVGSVLASETDEDALVTAERNFVKNQVDVSTLVVNDEYQYQPGAFDIVVANILAPVLIDMAGNLVGALRQNGQLLLSGILKEQAPDVITAFQRCGAEFVEQDTMDDWCALMFKVEK